MNLWPNGLLPFLAGGGVAMGILIMSLPLTYDEDHWVINLAATAFLILLVLAAMYALITIMMFGGIV